MTVLASTLLFLLGYDALPASRTRTVLLYAWAFIFFPG